MTVIPYDGREFPRQASVLVLGAGACGLVAALAARDSGLDVVVLEREARPGGSTALSSGMIPACNTNLQRAAGIDDDSAARLAADIQAKARGRADAEIVDLVCRESGPAIDWLIERHQVDLLVLNTKDQHQLAMHGMAYALAVELRQTPLLML